MYIYIYMHTHLDNSSQITSWLNLKLLVIIVAIYIITKLENDCGGWVPSALKFKCLAVSV